ncbi:MAG: tetratricopeptide repeat protein, partial [Betaproteobacteria bacterium]|nr:tetratricopeptide repeat protein [Betaproteobacteria bacterium]
MLPLNQGKNAFKATEAPFRPERNQSVCSEEPPPTAIGTLARIESFLLTALRVWAPRGVKKAARLASSFLFFPGCLAATDTPPAEIVAIYDKAFREFNAKCYEKALKELDTFDALATRPEDKAESLNLRGVVLSRQREYDGAEVALRKAIAIEPEFWNARFNLAQIPFLKQDWA